MQEITLKPQEIKLIDPRRTSLIPAVPKSVDPAPLRQKRNKAEKGLIGVTAASLLLNAVQAVIRLYMCCRPDRSERR